MRVGRSRTSSSSSSGVQRSAHSPAEPPRKQWRGMSPSGHAPVASGSTSSAAPVGRSRYASLASARRKASPHATSRSPALAATTHANAPSRARRAASGTRVVSHRRPVTGAESVVSLDAIATALSRPVVGLSSAGGVKVYHPARSRVVVASSPSIALRRAARATENLFGTRARCGVVAAVTRASVKRADARRAESSRAATVPSSAT